MLVLAAVFGLGACTGAGGDVADPAVSESTSGSTPVPAPPTTLDRRTDAGAVDPTPATTGSTVPGAAPASMPTRRSNDARPDRRGGRNRCAGARQRRRVLRRLEPVRWLVAGVAGRFDVSRRSRAGRHLGDRIRRDHRRGVRRTDTTLPARAGNGGRARRRRLLRGVVPAGDRSGCFARRCRIEPGSGTTSRAGLAGGARRARSARSESRRSRCRTTCEKSSAGPPPTSVRGESSSISTRAWSSRPTRHSPIRTSRPPAPTKAR